MSTSAATEAPVTTDVKVTSDGLVAGLRDGRVVSVPLTWYPRLASATPSERRPWELVGPGISIHWPGLDEDVSAEALLAGQGSNESARSLRRWQAARARPANKALQPFRQAYGRTPLLTRTTSGATLAEGQTGSDTP
ncbi:MAG: DUF2442 domain-containing protein [Acidobacteria bacterium]|nr:DUF2442 domain-containing protein [Acidobacteriota bacterium]